MEKQLVGNVSIKTNENRQPLEEEKDKVNNSEIPQNEKDNISFIQGRLSKMKSKRSLIDKNWNIFQRQFDAIYTPYRNGKTRSNIPLEHTVIEHFISEARNKKPKIVIKTADQGKESAIQLLRRVKDHSWKVNKCDAQTKKDDYICAIFGMSVLGVDFESKGKVIEDIGFKNEEIVYEKKLLKSNKIILKSINLNGFYWDDRADNFEDAVDCIYEFEMPYETFENLKFNKIYKNIDKISSTNGRGDYKIITKEYQGKTNVVNITAYYNKEKDRTILYANDERVIQDTPLLNPLKILPFAVRQFFYNPNNVSGRGVGELLLSTKSELNTLKEAAIEAIKRSNNEIFATGGDLEFDGSELNFNNTILKFNGQLQGNFQQITGTPPNSALFNYIQALYTEVAYWIGVDITSISGVKENTAYQTAVRQEMQSKVINNVLENRDEAYKVMGELYVAMLQLFYPRKLARGLIPLKENKDGDFETTPTDIEYPKLKLKKEKYIEGQGIIEDKRNKENYLEITPEMIRSNFSIEIETNYNQPTLMQSQRENIEARLKYVSELEALSQNSEEIRKNKEVLLDEGKRLYNVPIDAGDINDDSIKKEKTQLMNMIRQLAGLSGGQQRQGGLMSANIGGNIQPTNSEIEQLQRQDILKNKAPITKGAV